MMRIFVYLTQIFAVFLQRTGLIPALCHPRVILPFVKELEVFLVRIIESDHREKFFQMGDVAAVDPRPGRRLGRSDRMVSVYTDIGKFGRESIFERIEGEIAERTTERRMKTRIRDPCCARPERRTGTLPEAASKDHQLIDVIARFRNGLTWRSRRVRVLDGQPDSL